MAKHSPEIREYLYLDEHGIQTLYSQTVNRLEKARMTRRQRTGGAGLSVNAILSGKLDASVGSVEETTFALTQEQQVSALLETLVRSKKQNYFDDLSKATESLCQKKHTVVFVNILEEFDLPQFYPGGPGADEVNSNQYLRLEKGMRYDIREDYYKRPRLRVTMLANVTQLKRSRDGRMHPAGHDANYFRTQRGEDVPLHVFGSLSLTKDQFNIKPYAIWK